LTGLFFPYDSPRPGQEEVSRAIVEAAIRREAVAVEAPNGFGKTAAALAALVYLAAEQGFSCIYAVRTKREMERVLAELVRFGETAKSAPLLSMADGCLLKDMEKVALPTEVLPNYCKGSMLSGRCFYYDSLPRWGHFVPAGGGGIEGFIKSCQSLRVCPYYLGRDKAADSDIIVATYPHLLNEALRSQLHGMRKDWRKELAVFDEAHNLSEIIYLSSGRTVGLKEIEGLGRVAAADGSREEAAFCEKLRLWMRSLDLKEEQETVISAEQAIRSSRLQAEMETLLISQQRRSSLMFAAEPLNEGFLLRLRLVEMASSLARALGRRDSRVVVKSAGGDLTLAVRFLDVREEFSQVMKGLWSPVFLSATFFDFSGFASYLGLEGCAFLRVGRDPLERRCLTVVDVGVTTEYRKRDREEFVAMARRLANVGRVANGSTACFFPSYDVLEQVARELSAFCSSEVLKEGRSMAAEEQAEAVRKVTSSSNSMLLGVMGGKFSEGEDFSSGGLSAVAVVGLPLPPPTSEQFERMAFARSDGGPCIYDSLVMTPAVAKVVQAAGRLFRRKGQRGLVVLMDRRFGRKRVIELLPQWLKENLVRADTSDLPSLASMVAGAA